MFFKRHISLKHVRAGSVYRRVHPDNIVETARVLSVGKDFFGIPHVRFRVCFERSDHRRRFLEDARVLALESFAQQYGEQAGL